MGTFEYMKHLTPSLLVAATGLFIGGCADKGPCNALQTHYQYWDRIIEQTWADTVFQSPRFPLDTAWEKSGVSRTVDVYRESPGEEDHKSVMDSPPLHIDLGFRSGYTAEAVAHWQEDGFIGAFPNGEVPFLQLLHDVHLSLPALAAGTYAFGPEDTADGLTVDVSGLARGGPNNSISFRPDSLQVSGYIRIHKTFTAKSGSFSYYVKARYLSGQVSVFSGTAVFNGFSYYEDCSM